jgi:NitT/TauT family transport system substrate-binding protein
MAIIVAVTVGVAVGLGGPGWAAEKVRVGLDFTISGYHAPWFVALDKGWFTEQGLDVTIARGYGSGDTAKRLVTNVIDIGFHHPAPLIVSNAEGENLRIVMGYFVQEMCASYSAAEDGNVRKPKDLEGRVLGNPPGDACNIILPALAEKTGLDLGKIKHAAMDAPARLPMLASGQITATLSFYDKDILFKKALQKAGKSMVSFRFAEYIPMYSNSVVVHQRTLDARPEMVRRFLVAMVRGFKYTQANPDEAAAIVMKLYPESDREYIRASVDTLRESIWDETTKAKGVGIIDREKITATRDTIVKYWKLKVSPPVEKIFSNEHIEWAHQQAR